VVVLATVVLLPDCGGGGDPATPADGVASAPPRTFLMGFTGIPPRPDEALLLQTVEQWIPRADAGLLLLEPPWAELLAGTPADELVRADPLPLAEFYRGRGLRLVASIDPTNGLNRASEAEALVGLGRSLAEPEVRAAYAAYAGAIAGLVQPELVGVASETNLIRELAPAGVYESVVDAAGAAALEVQRRAPSVRLFTTVQVETAWGRLPERPEYVGITRDLADFFFDQALGLSSYPYLGGFADPEELPADYYDRLVPGGSLPMLVVEGGWTSESLGESIVSSPEEQRRYLERQAALLDRARAIGLFQLTFTDLDLPALGLPDDHVLRLFAHLGLVDVQLRPKPALAAWDATFARSLSAP
jgi:hypothetical protein